MNRNTIQTNIISLLDAIQADFPRRKREAEAFMANFGPFDPVEMIIRSPERCDEIPTFSAPQSQVPSVMLRARFDYAGTWDTGWHRWLSPLDMSERMIAHEILLHHRALRDHYEGSAPMIFPDSQLTLFGVTEGVPDTLIYLVWIPDNEEPELWSYDNYEFQRFATLEEYLAWYLNRP
jgi:hypothetical protein